MEKKTFLVKGKLISSLIVQSREKEIVEMIQKILSAVVNYCLSLTAELHSRFTDKKWRNKIHPVSSNNCRDLAHMI